MSFDEFHCNRTIKAIRKPHACEQCGRQITVGSSAIYSAGRFDGYFYTQHHHVECHAAGLAYAKATDLWGEEFTWFQHAESDQMDGPDGIGEWLIENHPIVAERLRYQRMEASA